MSIRIDKQQLETVLRGTGEKLARKLKAAPGISPTSAHLLLGNHDNATVYDFNSSAYPYEYFGDIYNDFFDVEHNDDLKAAESIANYVYPILLVIAVFGNISSAIVLYKMGCKVLATCGYLSLLAILDLFMVFSTCGDAWLTELMGYSTTTQYMNTSDGFCRSFTFLKSFTGQLSQWLLVTVAIECVWLIDDPKKCSRILTKFRARTTMLLLTLVMSLVNVHFFWTYMMMVLKENGTTKTHCTFVKFGVAYNKTFQATIWPLMVLVLNDILPMTIISVCIVLSVVKTMRKKKIENDLEDSESKTYFIWSTRIIKQLLFIMVLLGLLFVALSIPQLAWKLKSQYTYDKIFPSETRVAMMDASYTDTELSSMEFDAALNQEFRNKLIKATVSAIWYAFISCKIFVYLSISTKFREEFKKLLCCESLFKKQEAETEDASECLRTEGEAKESSAECERMISTHGKRKQFEAPWLR
ncbi:hypothetical protein CAPTEDRAFT_190662 [Capitella teleta]|uniref:G-protein coupled receptors family 1 profile domain-containing protein n=1 Tax=Capitella teleta TaxID=283909 RepID=R7T645_CAPTE|nr:hypothetical protein CAPTEDRAFT_190662 [Capitella teleta]|eukprot:ELT88850.1 hypothetical protein CAPTEDRAFT_190662 [Capitella teleta]